jgi:hypothetical protein
VSRRAVARSIGIARSNVEKNCDCARKKIRDHKVALAIRVEVGNSDEEWTRTGVVIDCMGEGPVAIADQYGNCAGAGIAKVRSA